MKKNIGNALALYPTPLVVVGAIVDNKPNYVLVGHLGIIGHDRIMISLSNAHYDTPAANSLYDMLPLDVTFEDFNSTEKIAYLTDTLNTDGEPDGCDPDIGDFCLYEPWGNLSVFYKDYKYSNSLIKLGKVESGLDIMTKQNGNFSVTLEKVN